MSLEERVAFVEGRVAEHSRTIDGIRDAVKQLEGRMDRRFEAVDRRFEALEQRLGALTAAADRRFTSVDDKMTRHFVWLVGVQVTTLAAIIAALAAR